MTLWAGLKGLFDRSKREHDSKRWHLVCTTCDHARSYHDMSDLRYKATDTGKHVMAICRPCQAYRDHVTTWIDPPPGGS